MGDHGKWYHWLPTARSFPVSMVHVQVILFRILRTFSFLFGILLAEFIYLYIALVSVLTSPCSVLNRSSFGFYFSYFSVVSRVVRFTESNCLIIPSRL